MNNEIGSNNRYIPPQYQKYDLNNDGVLSEEEISAGEVNTNIFESSDIKNEEISFNNEIVNSQEFLEQSIEIMYAEIEAKLEKAYSEIQCENNSKKGIGKIVGSIQGIFGCGSKGELDKIEKQMSTLLAAKNDYDKLAELYEIVMGEPISVDKINNSINSSSIVSNIQNGYYQNQDGTEITLTDLNESLKLQAKDLMTQMEETVSGQGIISKGVNWVNNILDIGTCEKEVYAKIENYQKLIDRLDNCKDPTEYAMLYKEITGQDFSEESINSLITYKRFSEELKTCDNSERREELKTGLDSLNLLNNSSAAEAIYDYQQTQESAVSGISGAISGIVSSVLTGLAVTAMAVPPFQLAGAALFAAKYAVAGLTSAAINTGIKALDGATSKKGYSWKQAGKDAAVGALNGIVNIGANAIGNKVTSVLGSKFGTLFNGTKQGLVKVSSKLIGETCDGAIDGAISSSGEYILNSAFKGEKVDLVQLGTNTFLGATFGGLTNMTLSGVSQLGSYGISKAKTLKSKIIKLKTILNDASEAHSRKLDLKTNQSQTPKIAISEEKVSKLLKAIEDDKLSQMYIQTVANKCEGTLIDLMSMFTSDDLYRNILSGMSDDFDSLIIDILSKSLKELDDYMLNLDDTAVIEQMKSILLANTKKCVNESGQLLLREASSEQIKETIEGMGIGATKIAQILSDNAEIMDSLAAYPNIQKALRETKTNCSFSRTFEDAQSLISRNFGDEIKLKKQLSAASVGETYIGETLDGKRVVVKMLKENATPENLQMEHAFFSKVIRGLSDNPDELLSKLDQLYKDWGNELDYRIEYDANKTLANSAQRYKVANAISVSADGKILVMDYASGIQANKLIEILKDYQTDPVNFATKYASDIEKYPWLGDPEKVIKDLPSSLTKAFDEQLMFPKQMVNGEVGSIMHGDPHTGNFFITTNSKGELIPEFIDTGLCVKRTSSQLFGDAEFMINYATGDSDGVAKYFTGLCDIDEANISNVEKTLSEYIQKNIFESGSNITKAGDIMNGVTAKLKELGYEISPQNTTAMKAELQFFQAIQEVGKLSGQSMDVMQVIKDLPKITIGMAKNGINPLNLIKIAGRSIKTHPAQSLGTLYQFKLTRVQAKALMKKTLNNLKKN